MRILGISSATKIISIGLIDEDKVLVETTLNDLHSEKILFYMQEAGIKPKDIDAVAVAAGPGSYSGLRGGLAIAKTLAQVNKVPLVGISTLEAIAYNLVDIQGTMAVILDSKGDEYNFALFGAHNGQLNRLTEDMVLKLDHIVKKLKQVSGEIYLVGNIKAARGGLPARNAARSAAGGRGTRDNLHFADEIHAHPYGINVARLGMMMIKAGYEDDPLKLSPKYSHKANAREFKKK